MEKPMRHKFSDVQSEEIGEDTKIWQFCVVLKGSKIGKNCNICMNVFIENDVQIGNNVTIKSGVQLWNGVRLEDDVFIGPNVTFTNDLVPRSKKYPKSFLKTIVKRGATIGANSTIIAGHVIGEYAFIGAGAVVTKDIPPYSVWYGNPARQHGFITEAGELLKDSIIPSLEKMNTINDVRLIEFPQLGDNRGQLVVVEGSKDIPFEIKRIFYIYGSDSDVIRGQHANRRSEFCLINVSGTSKIKVIDRNGAEKIFNLDRPHIGIYLPTMIWKDMYDFSSDSVLLVLSNEYYDKNEYIRNYGDFLNEGSK
jgi:acetyltransferase-like isoleucine patch superfamily enzyme/dTDP-4-dehydrorhamnose 3,5-epimerase-like enzyme